MKRIISLTVILSFAIFALTLTASAGAPGLMTYQGRLTEDGQPVNDALSMTFTIYEDPDGLSAIWTEDQDSVIVTDGLFTVLLGSVNPLADTVFEDTARWLGVKIEGDVEDITPRARLGGVPYAYRISTVDGATGGTISGDVAIQSDLDVDGNLRVTGKATIGPDHVNIGISNFVAGESNTANDDYCVVSGGYENTATGAKSTIGGGENNVASGGVSTVGGGFHNIAIGLWSTVGGGFGDSAKEYFSTVSGGEVNKASGTCATVGGGSFNTARGRNATVAGGDSNQAGGNYSFVGGGLADSAKNDYSTVGGGESNKAAADWSTIGGGYNNRTGGDYATVPGGYNNWANGTNSFAAGAEARASHPGTFVWADQTGGAFQSTGGNQFLIRASGGVGIGTNDPQSHGLSVTSQGDLVTGSTIYAENSTTGEGIALLAKTNGTRETVRLSQDGTGAIIRGYSSGSPVFTVTNCGQVVAPVVQITGGCDLAEPFPMSHQAAIPEGALVVIDDKNPGQLKLSDRPYDTRVAGIVSGAGGLNPGVTLSQQDVLAGGRNVALSGRVYALADASYGTIKPGDLLTTSDTPGHAMKALDRERAYGAVIGKAMTPLESGKGLVLVLVSLQ